MFQHMKPSKLGKQYGNVRIECSNIVPNGSKIATRYELLHGTTFITLIGVRMVGIVNKEPVWQDANGNRATLVSNKLMPPA